MLEQMVETKTWKPSRGFAECSKCRLRGQQKETVEHLLAGCKVLPNNSKYLSKHNRALMILAISWTKEFNLVEKDMKWCKEKWCREDKEKRILLIYGIAYPQENNIVTKRNEKRTKYRRLTFKLRDYRAEYKACYTCCYKSARWSYQRSIS